MSKKLTFEAVEKIIFEKTKGKCKLINFTETHIDMNIECMCGSKFSVLLGNFKKGKIFCNECSKDIHRQKEFTKIVTFIHSCGNVVLSKNNEYVDCESKINIMCKCGNVFKTTYRKYKYRNKRQCNECGHLITNNYQKRDIQMVYDLFDRKGLIPMFKEEDYKNTNSSLAFKCSKHLDVDVQYTTYNSLERDFAIGCTHCRNEKLREEFKEKNPRDYFVEKGFIPLFENEEYINSQQQLPFICKMHEDHGIQTANLNVIKNSKGCIYCSDSKSKGEIKIENYLNENNIKFDIQQSFPDCKYKILLKFDFFIYKNNELNLVVEYDGIQHFEPVEYWGGEKGFKEQQIRDKIKNEYCKKQGIPLLRIPYWNYDYIEEILENELISLVI